MKNRIAETIPILLVLVLMLTMAAGCPVQAPAPEPTAEETHIVIDMRGRAVELPRDINRAVTLLIPHPSIAHALGISGERIVGMHPTAMRAVKRGLLWKIAPEMTLADTGFVAEGWTVNIEELLKLRPDVVFQWYHWLEEAERIEGMGIPVIVISGGWTPGPEGTHRDLEEWVRITGEVFGKQERAAEIIARQREILERVGERTAKILDEDRPRVYFMFTDSLRTAGGDTHMQFWIEAAGGINVANEISGYTYVDMEQVLAWNPEVIFISNRTDIMPKDILQNRIEGQDWSHVDAVINRRVYKIPHGVFHWAPPNLERVLLVEWAAQKNFPEVFADLDIKQLVREFYREFFEYELTDEEIRTILHYDAN
ncbi:ABC transporter substrate-binding protein [Dehalococcoidia bacterium]|nr:ABC transporter substrate-binding protein [Dehalococcoidia bacterium]MCL0091095.1 ABC transporter substrate-binding protein [Dehalococcoidia bacterium]